MKTDFKMIHKYLLEIKGGIGRRDDFGICTNLLLKVQSNKVSKLFMHDAFVEIYGFYNAYPIEGSRLQHLKNLNKYDTSTEYGRARMKLLDELLKYCVQNFE